MTESLNLIGVHHIYQSGRLDGQGSDAVLCIRQIADHKGKSVLRIELHACTKVEEPRL